MADKDLDNPEGTQRPQGRGEGEQRADDASVDLNSEVLAHLQVLCEQLEAHVRFFADNASQATRQQLVDDLSRIRNDVVVLEKTATEFVLNELLLLLDADVAKRTSDYELKRVLSTAAPQLIHHMHSMQQNIYRDNALGLMSIVNDCRASRDEMLLSDVLMLAAGVEMPATRFVSISDDEWIGQRKQWVDYASAHHATLGQRLLHWWREERAGAVAPLRRQLDRFAETCDAHSHLQVLVPLFTSASLVAQAVSDKHLVDGPALRSLFAQLERNVHRCALVASPEDLLPEDLLRNFLFYVAQIEADSAAAATLRRRFRLDRVRMLAKVTEPSQTTTIGVEYHLINAIRNGVSQETKPLRAWLDNSDKQHKYPSIVRLRVRLEQLEPVLTLIGAKQALACLKLVVAQLQILGKGDIDDKLRAELADTLSLMDSELDQRARQSVVHNKRVDAVQVSSNKSYIDFAIDACLREARSDIQLVADRLLPLVMTQLFDTGTCATLVDRLKQVDTALQILPLPEVNPLFDQLCNVLEALARSPELIVTSDKATNPDAGESETEVTSVPLLLTEILVAFDDYLACVLQPQQPVLQFLADAGTLLEKLQSTLGTKEGVNDATFKRAPDLLSLPDNGGMTLDVEDDALELALEDEHPTLDSTLQFVFQYECLGHLESLDESVRFALSSSRSFENEARLPNEKMLRALHTLTGSAQTIGATDVVSIVQPLQRAALVLHREGRFFDVSESRVIGEILQALRSMFESLVNDEPFDGLLKDTQSKLISLLSKTVSEFKEGVLGSAVNLSIGSRITSLDDVFVDEAVDVLERLRSVIRSAEPMTEQSVNEAMALLHTLKGSARMAGKPSMSECAHELEAQVQLMGPNEDPLEIFKAGYSTLQSQLLQITSGRAADFSSQVVDDQNEMATAAEFTSTGHAVPDAVLDLATDLIVSQASTSDELLRLRDICELIDSSMSRWQSASQDLKLAVSCTDVSYIDDSSTDDSSTDSSTKSSTEVSNKDMHVFFDMMADMETTRSSLRSALRKAEREHNQASRVGTNLHQSLVRSRLVRLSDIAVRLSDTVEDTAKFCGVLARFVLTGGELMLDRYMYRLLVAPLEHLARNAVVHGVEPVEQRIAQNKPSAGLLSLSAMMDGADLVLKFSDDGRGIDREALNALLKSRGKSVVGSDVELQKLLFSTGFSSIAKADAIAGHGLGLAAVQEAVRQLDGEVQLDATLSQGVCITLRIPQRMIVSQIVLVRDGIRLYGIPVANVKWVNVDGNRHMPTKDHVLQDLQEVSLPCFLGETDHPGFHQDVSIANAKPSAVVLDIHDRLLSIQVEQVIGYREVVAQPLGAQLAALKRFSAGSVLPAGQQVLILDLAALSESLDTNPELDFTLNNLDDRPVALVVGDSQATRTIVEGMLQKKGIAVQSCETSSTALASLSRKLPAVMIVDMDMVGLDGFGVLRRDAKDSPLTSVPPIVVVSERDDRADREKAIKIGAAQWLVKPFDEESLHNALLSAGLRLPDLTIA